MDEAEKDVQKHHGREHLNESFKFRDPEQLNEKSGFQEAAQTDTKLEQLIDGSQEREDLRIAYQKYLKTRQRIASIEEQLRTYDLWFILLPPDFFKPQIELAGALEKLNMLKNLIDGQRANVLHLAEVWSSTNT